MAQMTFPQLRDSRKRIQKPIIKKQAVVPDIDPKTLYKKMKSGRFFLFLDVQSRAEYKICHIQGAHHIPLGELTKRLRELSRQTETVIYCRTGEKSRRAAEILFKAGFRRLHHLQGGLAAWVAQIEPEPTGK
jgi:rhodanese-related sulfurtransferase